MRRPKRPDTASNSRRHTLLGGGLFDVTSPRENRKGWEIFERGQTSFWAVPTAIPWSEPVKEDPELAPAIGAMLSFLCPGEKAAVTGASHISLAMKSEEAKFYFAEQALEEVKHYDALRRLIPRITGRPLEPPGFWVRLLYSVGVIDPSDTAFMVGQINIVGEYLARQIFYKLRRVAKDPTVRHVIELIGRDESRHIAAGQQFFPEVHAEFEKRAPQILVKNLAVTILLALATYELVNPMRALGLDLAEMMDEVYVHYHELTSGMRAFPEQALLDRVIALTRTGTPVALRAIAGMTRADGSFDQERFLAGCEHALRSPRALVELLTGR